MKPNVLFVTVDQWRADLLGCAGHLGIETPTIDELARAGTRFPLTYAQTPICIPARRSMMTGLTSRGHGDRDFQPSLQMPQGVPTLAECFGNAGYQTTAIGKLHVYPPRDRIGFDDVLLAEEGRGHLGGPDDYEVYLSDCGFSGQQYMHGMSNNEYSWRPWHLPEETHITNWTARMASRTIKRRDPTRPSLWHVSFIHPHPPIVPLQSYIERYAGREMDLPVSADWSGGDADQPYVVRAVQSFFAQLPPAQLADMRRAFFALCTHIDHQLRLIIGTLREEGLLDDTIIVFTSDHGDMMGDHGLYAKRVMYDASTRVPLVVVDRVGQTRTGPMGGTDDRLVQFHDLMPTMLDLAGIDIPETCEGISLASDKRRDHIYCESLSGARASRMVRDAQHKLIWYPAGNKVQLFDMNADPQEQHDLSTSADHAQVRARLEKTLVSELYGDDLDMINDGVLVGMDAPELGPVDNRGLSGQRGLHYPQPPNTDPSLKVGAF